MEPLPKPKDTLKRLILKLDSETNESASNESEDAMISSIFMEKESVSSALSNSENSLSRLSLSVMFIS